MSSLFGKLEPHPHLISTLPSPEQRKNIILLKSFSKRALQTDQKEI